MGYSYGQNYNGRWVLACDNCGHIGGVVKVRCPFNYCQATALCPACRKAEPPLNERRILHKNCKVYADAWEAYEVGVKMCKANGGYVLAAALAVGDDVCHVLFEGETGYLGFYMPNGVYDSVKRHGDNGQHKVLTPADYRAVYPGITPAPSTFKNGQVTKQVL